MTVWDKVKGFVEKAIWPQQKFSRVALDAGVLEDIIEFAKSNYPNEFLAILSGEISQDTLTINGLLYQHFFASRSSALTRLNLPMLSGAVGSVHSHPSSSTRPSRADLQFFAKTGVVHFIIGAPYREQDMACYDFEGNTRDFSVTQNQ
jgi:proteasome lid subunit RPN8/RPN11